VPTRNFFDMSSVGQFLAPPFMSQSSKANQLRWLWLGFGLTGVAMLSATAGALLAVSLSTTPLMQSQLTAEEAAVFNSGGISKTNLRLPELTRPVNILVLGVKVLASDLGEEPDPKLGGYDPVVNSFDGLSDTMLLLRFNPQTKKLTVLSIPRDTRTLVEGYGMTKINAANAYGGPALSAQAVSDLLGGVRIDRYVRINVQGVEKLIDALGGVTVYVPQDMKYTDNSQHLYIDLKAGKQHLNGNKALQLLRFRYDKLGDVGRVQRQQMVMRALMEQALNPVTLARVPQILSVIQSHLDTNLTVEELVALVGFGVQTNRDDAQMLLVPGEYSEVGRYDASYWLPHRRSIGPMMTQHFDLAQTNSRRRSSGNSTELSIAIQDSTGDRKAVERLVKKLKKAGYRNVYVAEPWTEPLSKTRIVAQTGDDKAAQTIRAAIDLGEVRVESTGHLNSNITIKLGRDWLQPKNTSD
jgi:polyisoprenyl-teichoic acid--peptidoglycan teichoic acid transferase